MQAVKSFVVMCAAGAVLSLSGLGTAVAQDAVMMGKNASECEIAAGLGVTKPGCPAAPGVQHKQPKTRGLAIGGNLDMPPPAAAPPPPRQEYTAAFQINFEFNSARLTPDAQQMLDKIGTVLGDSSSKFRIAGHTDGVGSPSRNQRLSAERAEAVKDYLASHFSIAGSRLESLGKGSRQLLNKADPAAAENRRVEITNLGG